MHWENHSFVYFLTLKNQYDFKTKAPYMWLRVTG